jgi:hypothetical protein
VKIWTVFNWFIIWSNGEFWWIQSLIFRFHKIREFLGLLNNYQLLKKEHAPWD